MTEATPPDPAARPTDTAVRPGMTSLAPGSVIVGALAVVLALRALTHPADDIYPDEAMLVSWFAIILAVIAHLLISLFPQKLRGRPGAHLGLLLGIISLVITYPVMVNRPGAWRAKYARVRSDMRTVALALALHWQHRRRNG